MTSGGPISGSAAPVTSPGLGAGERALDGEGMPSAGGHRKARGLDALGRDGDGDRPGAGRTHDRERAAVVGRDRGRAEGLLGARAARCRCRRARRGRRCSTLTTRSASPTRRAGGIRQRDLDEREVVGVRRDASCARPRPRAGRRRPRCAGRAGRSRRRRVRAIATSSPGRYSVSKRAMNAFSAPTDADATVTPSSWSSTSSASL